jgi:adenylate cyclase, class 2
MPLEVEIKFPVPNLRLLARKLRSVGFQQITPRTHEINTLYDLPGYALRKRNELLRLRKYGTEWELTHKSGSKRERHSSRKELETGVEDGNTMHEILVALGYLPSFRYEKFRAEWSDGNGHVVVDVTPIGNFCEIEGKPRWIDGTAKKLGVGHQDYITKNYATLFSEWKKQTGSPAEEMTFKTIKK